jgi:hypothetical protein
MTDQRTKTPSDSNASAGEAQSSTPAPYPQWKVELFRTRTADLHQRGAAHATGRAVRAPGA